MSITLSVVIPVFNKWELTRQCLASLASTLDDGDDVEVLVVDNASTDETARVCASTGRALFGERFTHLRQAVNRNFAGACNEGARRATGRHVFFLNNDTLLTQGWRAPLHRALEPDLAPDAPDSAKPGAVGPLLLYPRADGFADRVQHVGVTFGPSMQVSHLYEYFPQTHPLVHKERHLQAITAAAFMMERDLFFSVGAFDEGFVNGFEDVDLCARLSVAGYWMRCVPESVVYHLCGQTPGRNDHDRENSALLTKKCHDLLIPDKQALVEADGYTLRLSSWGTCEVTVAPQRQHRLQKALLEQPHLQCALDLLGEEPYWLDGYLWLARHLEERGEGLAALNVLLLATRFDSTPQTRLPLWLLAGRQGVEREFHGLKTSLQAHVLSREARLRQWRALRKRYRDICPLLAADADRHLIGEETFFMRYVVPLERAVNSSVAS